MASLFRGGYTIRNLTHTHFLTLTVIDWIEVFIRPQLADIVVDSLNYCVDQKGVDVHGWCLMPNHLHLLATHPDGKLSDFLRDFKRHTASKTLDALRNATVNESRKKWLLERFEYAGIKARQPVKFWQTGSHPIDCPDQRFFEQRLRYIHENPVKAGFVWQQEHYRYSSAIDYFGGKGLVKLALG